jgi:hypothetical protein
MNLLFLPEELNELRQRGATPTCSPPPFRARRRAPRRRLAP